MFQSPESVAAYLLPRGTGLFGSRGAIVLFSGVSD